MKLIPLDRVATSDNHENVTRRLNALTDENRHCNRYEDEMFAINYFQKGATHVIKRPERVENPNDIIAGSILEHQEQDVTDAGY
ncbi:DUF4942 domain-containing protein [Enterobacter ludwigii]|uniref:DUF4942 domain-containing protein n=1 Tax=Enterobacter ludwigii TaxID=299767 RepID=UPI001FBAD73B|nr:DUF4942 domain-containing protein [Enterobacter ludwigii]MDK9952723.1 DUF4942 domain-containing protein [Enterobacter ludwigii]UOH52913.1 DUF4942 domain-containing protein [Enterobacter ludwigii]